MKKIALSQLKVHGYADVAEFARAVTDHIAARKAHQSTAGQAAPVAKALVESAIERVQHAVNSGRPDDFVAAYEVIDDTPPAPTLDQRKMKLAVEARALAQAALAKITPPLKARLWAIEVAAALAVDPAKRTPSQASAVAAHEAREARRADINLRLARIESDIHDLSEATIGAFKIAAFPAYA
jgi:hypothetical protein